MRFIVIKQTADLPALSVKLLKAPTGNGSQAALEHVQALNPHVDLQRIEAGTVLLLPDLPGLKTDESRSLGTDAFDTLASDIDNGLKAAANGLRAGSERLAADREAVSEVLKTTGVKRLLESDPLLKQQIDDAKAQSAADQKGAQEAAQLMEALHKGVTAELALVARLLG